MVGRVRFVPRRASRAGQEGRARVPVTASALGGAGRLSLTTAGFTLSGCAVTPACAPGLPLVLAAGAWLGGLNGALLVPAVLGGCALLSFGGLAGRLCGPWWGVAAKVALGACLPEVYTARAPFPAPLVQVLLFGGLSLLTDSREARRGPGRWGGTALAGLASGPTAALVLAPSTVPSMAPRPALTGCAAATLFLSARWRHPACGRGCGAPLGGHGCRGCG
jgi:hypothetical protein